MHTGWKWKVDIYYNAVCARKFWINTAWLSDVDALYACVAWFDTGFGYNSKAAFLNKMKIKFELKII
jgi:hypothetical protein